MTDSDLPTDAEGDALRVATPPPESSWEARERIIDGLRLDLVGPSTDHELAEECLPQKYRPSNWYLTGFLIPTQTKEAHRGDLDSDEELEGGEERQGSSESAADAKAAKKSYFPSSMGLSFLVAPGARELQVRVRWGDYEIGSLPPRKEGGSERHVWRRVPRERAVAVDLAELKGDPLTLEVPDSGGVRLTVLGRSFSAEQLGTELPAGTRSVSVFLVNDRDPQDSRPDAAYLFQPELQVASEVAFVPRPDLRGRHAQDLEEAIADLHFADAPEYASGHGVSVEWGVTGEHCYELTTSWMPRGDVERTVTAKLDGVELGMDALGALRDGEAARAMLMPLVEQYRDWIAEQAGAIAELETSRRETAETLLDQAAFAAKRIEDGIAALASDPQALDAFATANRAVARALRQRLKDVPHPAWRAFQLAFVLLNVESVARPEDPKRDMVDLLFFPTGGGKTEAYLGLAAYTMVLRRLRNPGYASAGVSVLMRYTLRLLTLDQLGRAAGLVCALELEREEDTERLGPWPFEIGLWVGKAATPNVMGRKGGKGPEGEGSARDKVQRFKADPTANPAPIPIENCPWCGERFEPDSFELEPYADEPKELRVLCMNEECEFNAGRDLPIVAVDEPLYRRLPAFLISTVDKFASLPFVGPSGMLMGGATRMDADGFYGPSTKGKGKALSAPLLPPDLVIQDELHLISGPMGTMAGLYETALEELGLCSRDGKTIRPKIVASTATARRADDQVRALFGRAMTRVFPPPGPSRRDSFFAETRVSSIQDPARSYLGIAAQGRSPKVVYRRLMTSLMSVTQQVFWDAGGYEQENNVVDPYMTALGYFGSLRELGGSRRILEEEVRNTLKSYGEERRRMDDPCFRTMSRERLNDPVELTSRVSTSRVARAKRQLEAVFWRDDDRGDRVDFGLATNMISVGLDIPRLGLMVVVGQPKTHSEYIQASSRVGRETAKPGLVVTLLNLHKPRDRSHYERFRHYHETFYRSVEAATVTPFSSRALDRGMAGVLVAMARHMESALTPPVGAGLFEGHAPTLRKRFVDIFTERMRAAVPEDEQEESIEEARARIEDLVDSWLFVGQATAANGKSLEYQKYEGKKDASALLQDMLEDQFESEHHRKFRANRSLRDVEPAVLVELREYQVTDDEADA